MQIKILFVFWKHSNLWIGLFFFQMSFFYSKCAQFLVKIGKDLNIEDQKSKKIEIDEIYFYHTFDFNVLLALKIMNFENVTLTKIIHFYAIKTWMHKIHDIKSICKKLFVFNT